MKISSRRGQTEQNSDEVIERRQRKLSAAPDSQHPVPLLVLLIAHCDEQRCFPGSFLCLIFAKKNSPVSTESPARQVMADELVGCGIRGTRPQDLEA